MAGSNLAAVAPHRFHNDWLSREELDQLTPAKLIQRASDLRDLVDANAQEAERLRHPVDSVMAAIRRAGLFYHFVPKMYGGLEFDVESFVDTILPIAEGCTSTGWVTGFCIQHNFLVAQFPKQTQDEIFGSFPYVITAGSGSPPAKGVRVPGGLKLSGHLKYASGIMHADYFQCNALVPTDGPNPGLIFCLIPVEEITILDAWFVDGMAGSGSQDVLLEDVFVPTHRSLVFEDLREGRAFGYEIHKNPLYRASVDIILNISSATPAIGAARAAVALFRKRILERASPDSNGKQSVKSTSQIRLSEAALAAWTGEMIIREMARQIRVAAEEDISLPLKKRIQMRARIAYAVDLARHAVRTVLDGGGSSAHFLSNPLQRYARDVATISSHVIYDMDLVRELLAQTFIESTSPTNDTSFFI